LFDIKRLDGHADAAEAAAAARPASWTKMKAWRDGMAGRDGQTSGGARVTYDDA